MNEPKWVLEAAAKAIQGMLLSEHGGEEGVRDIPLLESALNRVPQEFAYNSKATVFELAAAYSFEIAKSHPFISIDKRMAFMAGVIFLEINGYKFVASESESTAIFEGLAGSKISEYELSMWFEQISKKA